MMIVGVILLITIAESKEDLEDIVKELSSKIIEMEKRLITTEQKLMATEEESKVKNISIQKLEQEVSFLKEPPWTFACAAHPRDFTATKQIIVYESLLYSSTNIPESFLDISTGVFTSGYPGSYTATWAFLVSNLAGGASKMIYLRKNGINIDESLHR
jgi:hypothetical protein